MLNILRTSKLSETLNDKSGELQNILPELSNLYTTNDGHKNNFYHTLIVLDNVCSYDNMNLKMKIVALLHDIGKLDVRRKNDDNNWTFQRYKIDLKVMQLNIAQMFLNSTNPAIFYTRCYTLPFFR
jgi:hypothetical protein